MGAVGEYFRKFVGIIYLSEDKSTVIISHNTFFGHRRDREVKVENIIPLRQQTLTLMPACLTCSPRIRVFFPISRALKHKQRGHQCLCPISSETPENPEEITWRIVLYSGTPRSYYICTRFGGILNQEEFAEIFGAEPK